MQQIINFIKRQWRLFVLLVAIFFASALLSIFVLWSNDSTRKIAQTVIAPLVPSLTPTPRASEADIRNAAIIATYEAQVFPEPTRTDAYTAIVWTIRNLVEIGFGNAISYSDERVLNYYSSYPLHKNDVPDPRAVEIAYQVLTAPNRDNDPTQGARHYVDHSYWTGTSEQIGDKWKYRGRFSDTDVQRLVDDGKFSLTVEWKSDRPGTPVFYGLYFFDYWPPVTPVVTPLPTFTPTRTPTRTRTPTITLTPRFTTPSPAPTPITQPYPKP